jgi:hypothetical protein
MTESKLAHECSASQRGECQKVLERRKNPVAILFSPVLGILCLVGAFSFFASCETKKNQNISFVDVTAESRILSLYGADFLNNHHSRET